MSFRAVQKALSPPGRTLAVRYVLIASALDLVWEIAQLPLYTIWLTATTRGFAYAVIHCTLGDVIILLSALVLALLLVGDRSWPRRGYAGVAVVTTALGISYMLLSEYMNVEVWRNWAYASAMPLLPPLRTGLTPFLQWLIIPPVALRLVRPSQQRGLQIHIMKLEDRAPSDSRS